MKAVGYPKIMHGVGGHLTRKEANFLYDASQRLGPGMYAELGTFKGRSALCIAGGIRDNNVDAHLVTIDTFDARAMTHKTHDSQEEVQSLFEEKGVSSYITVIKGFTVPAAEQYLTTEFNFIFIDADHSYEACKADFEAWSPLLKSGGEIAFHDSHYDGPGRVIDSIDWSKFNVGTITTVTKP